MMFFAATALEDNLLEVVNLIVKCVVVINVDVY